MYKLINMSNYPETMDRFDNKYDNIREFLNQYKVDGIELIQYDYWNEDSIPKDIIKGLHLRFYPMWLDFWREDNEQLLKKFQSEENIKMFYGGLNKKIIVDRYKKELEIASKIGVEYVVFHVSHVDFIDSYTYDFEYSDEEVINAAIELINEVFDNGDYSFKLLFENLWWPGLTLKNKVLAQKLIDEVKYENTGFMLDTAHLINTNPYLKNSGQAVDYILDVLKNLGELKKYIKGMHLNYSLSGEHVLKTINEYKNKHIDYNFKDMYMNIYSHICKIDTHDAFINNRVEEIIKLLDLDVVVYEFSTESLDELKKYIEAENRCLCNIF